MYYSAEIAVDHITDHLPFRSTRKQWTGERRRARFSRRKGAEKAIFSGNCLHRSVWDHQAAGSIPVTRTKILTESRVYSPLSVIFYAYLGISPPLLKKSHFYDHIIKCGLKIPLSLFTAVPKLRHVLSGSRLGFVVRDRQNGNLPACRYKISFLIIKANLFPNP